MQTKKELHQVVLSASTISRKTIKWMLTTTAFRMMIREMAPSRELTSWKTSRHMIKKTDRCPNTKWTRQILSLHRWFQGLKWARQPSYLRQVKRSSSRYSLKKSKSTAILSIYVTILSSHSSRKLPRLFLHFPYILRVSPFLTPLPPFTQIPKSEVPPLRRSLLLNRGVRDQSAGLSVGTTRYSRIWHSEYAYDAIPGRSDQVGRPQVRQVPQRCQVIQHVRSQQSGRQSDCKEGRKLRYNPDATVLALHCHGNICAAEYLHFYFSRFQGAFT